MEQKKYFDILQVYRGIAALLVVIHHTYASFAHFKGFDIPMLDFIAKIGKLGVDFFFVLSGFIIAFTTFKYRGNKGYVKQYLFNRVTRVYIPYLPISFGMIALYFFLPGFSDGNRSVSILTSLTLLPYGNPALSVAWTLVFEMFFYLIYSINFFSKKIWIYFISIWVASIFVCTLYRIEFENAILKLLFSMYNIEFITGVLVAYIVKSNLKIKYGYLLFVAVVLSIGFLFIKYFEISLFPFFQNLFFTINVTVFVIIGVLYWNKKINSRNCFMLVGNSSYSLYLLHNPLQSFLVRLFPQSKQQYILLTEFIVVIFIIIVISYIYYYIFEKKIILFVKNKFDNYVS